MKAYGIVLVKNDETEAKIVTKETYDWIVSPPSLARQAAKADGMT